MTTHAYIRIYCSVHPQLPPVIGAPWGCCGHASGISFPRLLWFGGCETHATPCSVPGYSYFRMCLKKSERNCLTSYLYNAAILASFLLFACLKGCFRLSLSTRNKKKRTVTPVTMVTKSCTKILILPKIFPTRLCFTPYGNKILRKIFQGFSHCRKCTHLAKS